MSTISLVRGKYRALIRKANCQPLSKSFATKEEAAVWARDIETELDAKRLIIPERITFGRLVDRYIEDMESKRPMGRGKRSCLLHLKKCLGDELIGHLTAQKLVQFGQERGVAGPTLTMDLAYISATLRYAKDVLGIALEDHTGKAKKALKAAGLVHAPDSRDRRPTPEEIAKLKAHFAEHSRLPMGDIMDFAIATGMRAGEIERIGWADYDPVRATVLIRDRKDPRRKLGNHQRVPLLKAALEVIERQPKGTGAIFPYQSATWSSIFPRACRACGIHDLRFHDLRHEGISRLFEMGYQIQEVAMFSGHKTWAQLSRYTQLKAENLRRLG